MFVLHSYTFDHFQDRLSITARPLLNEPRGVCSGRQRELLGESGRTNHGAQPTITGLSQ